MPSLIQTGEFAGPGYPLVQGGSAIVALGAAAGDQRVTEDSDVRITEDGDRRVPE
jgi:hypothetical protein